MFDSGERLVLCCWFFAAGSLLLVLCCWFCAAGSLVLLSALLSMLNVFVAAAPTFVTRQATMLDRLDRKSCSDANSSRAPPVTAVTTAATATVTTPISACFRSVLAAAIFSCGGRNIRLRRSQY
jgi:hypothetical protein